MHPRTLIIFLSVITAVYQFTNCESLAQPKRDVVIPPTLKNGQRLGNYLRLGYRGDVNTFFVITLKFKVSPTGFLDTLSISENAPQSFVKKAKEQLYKLDGRWNPQRLNGKPVRSKWLLSRYYIAGFREDTSACTKQLQQAFFEAFKRDQAYFVCDKILAPPSVCLIEYIEAYDAYIYPPLLSETVR